MNPVNFFSFLSRKSLAYVTCWLPWNFSAYNAGQMMWRKSTSYAWILCSTCWSHRTSTLAWMRWKRSEGPGRHFVVFHVSRPTGDENDWRQHECKEAEIRSGSGQHSDVDGWCSCPLDCARRFVGFQISNGGVIVLITGNIDQMQYCDKVKNLVEHLGTKLSLEELSKIWRMQVLKAILLISFFNYFIASIERRIYGCYW